MDTTLRDGEQTSGVSFAAHEKLSIAQVLLKELGVNRVEVASARVSEGEFEAVRRVAAWAARTGYLDKLEVLGFVDGTVSLDWIESAGCRVVNLLCKGSYKHVTEQLRKTPPFRGTGKHADLIHTHSSRLHGYCLEFCTCRTMAASISSARGVFPNSPYRSENTTASTASAPAPTRESCSSIRSIKC